MVEAGTGTSTGIPCIDVFIPLRLATGILGREAGVDLLRAEGGQRFHAKAKWYELDIHKE